MSCLTTKKLGYRLISICSLLKVGRYQITFNPETKVYGVVIYNNANYGIFAGIYNINHVYLENALISLSNSIDEINKIETNSY